MTSHIFLAAGMWRESVAANLARIATVDRHGEAKGMPPFRCGHYSNWLSYSYLQLGEFDEARRALGRCRDAVQAGAADEHPGHSMDPDESLSGPSPARRFAVWRNRDSPPARPGRPTTERDD
jgi:hypothetical protein